MTDPNVTPVDPSVDPAPAPEVEEEENDDELEPEDPGVIPPNETPEQKDARIKALEERNGKLWARLKRAKNKPASAAPAAPAAPAPAAPAAAPGLSRDEAILYAKGFSEEEVEYAKKVSLIQGVSPTKAIEDDLFTGWKAKRDKDAKDKAAQLGVSRGGKPTTKKTLATPGLSDEEHKALAKEKLGL